MFKPRPALDHPESLWVVAPGAYLGKPFLVLSTLCCYRLDVTRNSCMELHREIHVWMFKQIRPFRLPCLRRSLLWDSTASEQKIPKLFRAPSLESSTVAYVYFYIIHLLEIIIVLRPQTLALGYSIKYPHTLHGRHWKSCKKCSVSMTGNPQISPKFCKF